MERFKVLALFWTCRRCDKQPFYQILIDWSKACERKYRLHSGVRQQDVIEGLVINLKGYFAQAPGAIMFMREQ